MTSEKEIHKESLTEVVKYLNKENNTNLSDEEEAYSKKNIRQMLKSKKKALQKTKREVLQKSKIEIETNEKNLNVNKIEKLSRKERRDMKMKNKGKGLSSKEYMKIVKEGPNRKIEKEDKVLSKLHFPSKQKSEFPKAVEKPKKRFKKKKSVRK